MSNKPSTTQLGQTVPWVLMADNAGHRFAQELDEIVDIDEPLKHDLPDVGAVLPTSRSAETARDCFGTYNGLGT